MAELYLIRHGQASFGSSNYDQLSELGHQQSHWLGEYFLDRGIEFDTIITGDMQRHRETAEGICQGLHIQQPPFAVFSELNEFDFQALIIAYISQFPAQTPTADTTTAEYFKLLKKAMQLWIAGELREELPESWTQFEHRIAKARQEIQQQFHGQKVLAVSSGGAIAMALRQILHAPSETVIDLNLQTKNTAIAHCFFNPKVMRMNSYNHVPHLDSSERIHTITYS
ncbi:MAG: histidine phosphatase family protein [Spongiibacteraceae bacterium]